MEPSRARIRGSSLRKYRLPFMPAIRGWRPQWLPWFMNLNPETCDHPHIPEDKGDKFLAYGGFATEAEVLNWLYATILLKKPENVLETGAAGGLGTMAMAAACKANGFGHVHSLEYDKRYCEKVRVRLKAQGLADWATLYHTDSLEFLKNTDVKFDFAFFDSVTEIRPDEYRICRERGLIGPVAAFHDTSKYGGHNDEEKAERTRYRERLFELAKGDGVTGFMDSNLSRGIFVIFHDQD